MKKPTMLTAAATLAAAALLACAGSDAAGAATLAQATAGSEAKRMTGIHLTVVNETGQTLTLEDADCQGHWQQRALATLAPGESEEITNYSKDPRGGGDEITLHYSMFGGHYFFGMQADVPTVGSNDAYGSTTDSTHSIDAVVGSGYHPHDTYTLR